MQTKPNTREHLGIRRFRVRYADIDQMGTFYNSRALDWFECGRVEFMRDLGISYAESEKNGIFLPVIEAWVKYHRPARFDDMLRSETRVQMMGRMRMRFDVKIFNDGTGTMVVEGYTVHTFVDKAGRPMRPNDELLQSLGLMEV